MRSTIVIAAGLVVLTACEKTESPQQRQARMEQETQQLQQRATTMERRWEAWTAAGQADSFAQLFAEQGREMPPHAPNAVGKSAILAFHQQSAAIGSMTVQIHQEEVRSNGDVGVERGMFTTTLTPGPNTPPTVPPADTGKYLIHWQRVNGTWLIHELIWNSNLPIPTPPPAPARRR